MEWVDTYDLLLEPTLWLQHLTAGQPMRGTEIASLQLRSTATDRGHVFVYEREIMIMGSHNKSNKARGAHSIPHFVAPPLSALLIDTLVVARPIYEALMGEVLKLQDNGTVDVNSFYLRKGKRLTPDDLGNIITKGFNDYAGLPRVSIRIWRQCWPFYFRDRHGTYTHEESLVAHLPDLAVCVMEQWGKMEGEDGDVDAWMKIDDVNDIAVCLIFLE